MPDQGDQYCVMQVTETGEEFCVSSGDEGECFDWIEDNREQFPESKFYVTYI